MNIELNCAGPETPFSVEEQIQIIEQSITDGVDGVIVIRRTPEAITTAIENATMPISRLLPRTPKPMAGDVVTWIGADNVEVGYTLGKIMCESINGKGNVVLLEGTPATQQPRNVLKDIRRQLMNIRM